MNILFLVASSIAHILLCLTTRNIVVVAFITLALAIVVYISQKKGYIDSITKIKLKKDEKILFYIFLVLYFSAFCARWITTGAINTLASKLKLPGVPLIIVMASCITLGASFFVKAYVRLASTVVTRKYNDIEESVLDEQLKITTPKDAINIALIIIFSVFGLLMIETRCSFLYPFNDDIDINCFFTVGKGMFNGLVPYKDLFEQKGPLLYFFYGISYLLSNDTFAATFLIEIIAGCIWMYVAYKTFSLFRLSKIGIIVLPILSFVAYSSTTFGKGGSAEELCTPILAYVVYLGVKHKKENKLFSWKECILVGFLGGCVFWTKFTLTGTFVGWFIILSMLAVKNNNAKRIISSVIQIFIGVILATCPWIIYFGINNSIRDWFEVYIYDNIFYYSSSNWRNGGIWYNLSLGLNHIISVYTIAWFVIIFAIVYAWTGQKKEQAAGIIMLVPAFIFAYIGGTSFTYYAYFITAFLPVLLISILDVFNRDKCISKARYLESYFLIVIFVVISLCTSNNKHLIGVKKSDTPYYRFKEIICKEENATLFNYNSLDMGFYTVCDILPSCRAFCKLNNPVSKFQDEHRWCYENAVCEFVVTMRELEESSNYILVDSCKYNPDGEYVTYYLYQRK